MSEDSSSLPKVHLYIKGSHNLRSVDGSLFCHVIHLFLRAKKTDSNFDLDICLVNTNKIPDEIKKDYTGRLPAIRLSDNTWVDDVDEITKVIEDRYPEPPMVTDRTDDLIEMSSDIMRKFVHFLQFDDRTHLVEELRKLEQFLGARQNRTRFLSHDRVMVEDCFLLPKLLQVMIAGKVLKNFELPEDFVQLKQYLTNAIDAAQFVATRPSQAEIVLRWCTKTKSDVNTLMKENESFRSLAKTVTMIGTLALRQKKQRPGLNAEDNTPPREVHTFSGAKMHTTISYSFTDYGGRVRTRNANQ